MRLEAFIAELLLDHDCVVLPDFGGLVANYRAARLNRRSHMIFPPSKHVGFNRNLLQNDGLLANHIAAIMGISYKEAQLKIEEAVADYHVKLNKEGRLVLDRIGVFFKDKGGHLQFIPDEQENFLLSSFGLTPIQLKPVEVATELSTLPETPVIKISDERRKTSAWKIAAAIAIPLLLGGGIMLRNQIKGNDNFNFASLNPFQSVNIGSSYAPDLMNWNVDITPPKESALKPLIDSSDKNLKYDFLNGTPSEEGIVIRKNQVVAPAVTTDVNREADPLRDKKMVANHVKRFSLIGGAFQIEENAQKFLNKLIADGFDAEYAGTKDGLKLVAYGTYESREDAVKALQNVKAGGGHAWIKRN